MKNDLETPAQTRPRFMVKTLGCKANYADGQLLEAGLMDRGFSSTQSLDQADFVIVNSCTVTDEADKQSQKLVKEIYKKNPNAKVIYTGCGAEVDPETALKLKGVSAVIGNQDKTKAASLIQNFMSEQAEVAAEEVIPQILGGVSNYTELASRHPMDREWPLPDSAMDEVLKLTEESSTFRTRSFIKIQEGCDSFCTYCIIPYGRGPARSLPIETIVSQINELVAHGIQEVVLTGTNIGDYGLDWAKKLMVDDLLEAILTQTKLPRLRIGSLDPTEISDRMIELMEKYEAFCPHFHVSLQNMSSKVLKLMKRKYQYEHIEACLTKLGAMKRKPFVGMDYITGFPGESDADFQESLEKIKTLYWSRLHVFPYSERARTPATKLPNVVPVSKRKERARELQALSLERLTSVYSTSRQAFENGSGLLKGVLLESHVKGPDGTHDWVSGYAPHYQRVVLPMKKGSVSHRNEIIDIEVSHWLVDRASGEVSWIASGGKA
jgi:threonylcarbamoyladenosine tRNA methylthiotransferase MtaB